MVDGSKVNMDTITYLYAAVTTESLQASSEAHTLPLLYSGTTDLLLASLTRNVVTKAPAWVELVGGAPITGPTHPFTGTQTLFIDGSVLDTNLRLHLLMGCGN